jgi:hypothetical protein
MLRALLGSCLLCCGGGTPAGGVLIGTPPPGEGVSAGSVAAAAFKNGASLAQNVTAGVRCGGFSGFSVYLWFAMMIQMSRQFMISIRKGPLSETIPCTVPELDLNGYFCIGGYPEFVC